MGAAGIGSAVLNNTGVGQQIKGQMGNGIDQFNQNGGLLGQAGGAPQMANIQEGTNKVDVTNAQEQARQSLLSQQNLLQALQGQNGIGMQNQAATAQQNLAGQLANANGVGVQQGAVSGLQNTAGMYQNIANGVGPNPAQAMLNQQTGQNVANQAALMAGQRGASSNVGLMARQAAQQGAATQQQAVGQGATMQANQQLNALSGLSGAQQAIGGLGGSLTGQQMGANQAYTNQANQVAGQQIAQQNANTQANLANQQAMQNSLQGINNSNVSSQGNVNTGNVGLSQSNTAGKQSIFGGGAQALGTASGFLAEGGMVHMAEGGAMASQMAPAPGPSSSFGQFLNSYGNAAPVNNQEESSKMLAQNNQQNDMNKKPDNSGKDKLTSALGMAAMAAKGGLAKGGGPVDAKKPSQKPVKEGNSYSNDKIPAMLSEGEIVLPRSVTQSNDPVGAASKFVSQVLAKRKAK